MPGPSLERSQEIGDAADRLGGLPDLASILQGTTEAALTALGPDRATCHAHRVEDQVVTAVFTTEPAPERRALLERNIGQVATSLPICGMQVAQADPVLVIEDVANDPAVPPPVVERIGSGAVLGVRLEHPSVRICGVAGDRPKQPAPPPRPRCCSRSRARRQREGRVAQRADR